VPRLAGALAEVVRRHEILRMEFSAGTDGIVQIVHPPAPGPVEIAIHSVADAPAAERRARAEAVIRDAIATPFDLTHAPLYRVAMAQMGEGEALLAFIVHHVALDGWSAVLVFREAFAIYETPAGKAADLPPLSLQYADFARGEREALASGSMAGDRAAWLSRLDGEVPLPPLPFGRAAQRAVSGKGGRVALTVAAPLADRLRALARAHNTTLFATMGAAFAALLSRHAGREDILIAAPMTNRDRPELAALAGLFINTVLLRLPASAESSFAAFLSVVRDRVLEAQSHQRYPFQALLEDLRASGSITGQPLASVMFDLQRLPQAMDPAGLTVEYLEIDAGTSKFDLGLSVKETDGPLHASFEYASAVFARAEISCFAEQYLTILERICEAPDTSLAALVCTPPPASGEAVQAPEPTAVLVPLDTTIEEVARSTPTRMAVRCGAQALTYAALVERAEGLVRRLLSAGVCSADRVALLLPRGTDQLAAVLACWKVGAAYVALDPLWPKARLDQALAVADARCVLTTGATAALCEGESLRVDVDAAPGTSDRSLPLPAPEGLCAPAYGLFTSGSTGTPRLAMVNHRNLANLDAALQERLYATLPSAMLNVALNGPLSFDTCVKQLIQLGHGHTLHIVPEEVRADAAAFVRWLAANEIEVLDATPLHAQALLEAGLGSVSSLRMVLVGGDAIGPDLWHALAALAPVRAYNMYGPTETTADALVAEISGQRPVLGTPLANVHVSVVDAALRPLPVGVAGELLIAGDCVGEGYFGDATATAARFIVDGSGRRAYRTGDRVRRLTDGTMEFAGRVDDQIKLRGHRIEPGEVEAALKSTPGIREAAVVAHGEGAEKHLVAYVAAVPHLSPVAPVGPSGAPARRLANGLQVHELNPNE
ncbi:MAG: amino acid adenylation domain-containing protein, partial [Pseudomonadota bacterium]